MPYVEIHDDKENGKSLTIRRKLLDYFEKKYEHSSFYRKQWADFHIQAKKYTVQRFFEDNFHSTFMSLPFENIDNKYLILHGKDLKKPVIP